MEKKTNARSRRGNNKWAMPVGITVVILAVIGLAAILFAAGRGIASLTDRSAKKAEYEAFINPVVMFDPDPFDDVSKGNQSQLINAAIWALLRSDIDTSMYATDDGNLSIPQADVEKSFAKLFGSDVKPTHTGVTGMGYEFKYDSAGQKYIVPITGVSSIYTPRVTDISSKGNTIELTVGYLGSGQWEQAENGDLIEPSPDKYMKIILRKNGDEYYISAIRATDAPETAASSSQEPSSSDTAPSASDSQPSASDSASVSDSSGASDSSDSAAA